MSWSVVVPSKDWRNLSHCLAAIHRNEEHSRVIVIDDGLEQVPCSTDRMDITILPGIKEFIFARNVNLGIKAAGADDVLILNDDAMLQTEGGFTALADAAAKHPEYGVISSSCNNTGNLNQHPKGKGLRDEPRMVCFICAYIPRATIERIGLLDERFVDYGLEDDDYCFVARKVGLKIGVFDGCFVDHAHLKSTFRSGPSRGNIRPNMRRFIEKHGCDNWGHAAGDPRCFRC